jgi:uncharacterized protein (UPF0332 family)
MNPSDFITFAAQVVGFKAAGARSAVSRAYYGVFHCASALLEELGLHIQARSLHGKLDLILADCGNENGDQAGKLIGDLHSDRIKADYKLAETRVETREFAINTVEAANVAHKKIELLRADCGNASVRDAVTTAIRSKCVHLGISVR